MTLYLEQRWTPDTAEHGGFAFTLWNTGTTPLAIHSFCYASMTRLRDDARLSLGTVTRKFANHVEIALPKGTVVAPGAALTLTLDGLTHKPTNRTQGAMAAWTVAPDGTTTEATLGDLLAPEGHPLGPVKDWPEGTATALAILPWPNEIATGDHGPAPLLCPAPGCDPAPFAQVAALHRRLFPDAPALLLLSGGHPVRPRHSAHPPGGYTLDLGGEITLSHADADGLRHGLITLAQIAHAARTDPRFAFPRSGRISDAPRHGWRGCHLDVSRNFRDATEVRRLLDILAWHKFNRFHWHLSDDEGYRLPSRAFPALTTTGARRGGDAALPPQYADGPRGQSGHYSHAEVDAVVAHAAALGIEVVPEIDLPGHVTAILAAIPGLTDPAEPPDSYRSIQGYPNNALNPALEETYRVVETLIHELCEMFPGPVIHVGGDEVDHASWSASPAAQALAQKIGATDAMGLQSHFMRRVQAMVHARGRILGGWDECALGGGIAPERTVLMAWQTTRTTARLIAEGFDVVATPGQAYYLDMVQGAGWDAIGASWAGPVPVEQCYRHEATAGLPDGPGRLIGVQAGIWTEHIATRSRFNEMVFPRLSAVAEAGWTEAAQKDWDRFCALARLMPQL
jgi:hexosaminidase